MAHTKLTPTDLQAGYGQDAQCGWEVRSSCLSTLTHTLSQAWTTKPQKVGKFYSASDALDVFVNS